jgi:hypothetical protein
MIHRGIHGRPQSPKLGASLFATIAANRRRPRRIDADLRIAASDRTIRDKSR